MPQNKDLRGTGSDTTRPIEQNQPTRRSIPQLLKGGLNEIYQSFAGLCSGSRHRCWFGGIHGVVVVGMSMMLAIKRLFCRPTAAEVAIKSLEEAELRQLDAHAAQEYAAALAGLQEVRINRLRAYLNAGDAL